MAEANNLLQQLAEEARLAAYAPDAWADHDKTKIGYEISFNRYFYKPTPLRSLEEIRADIPVESGKFIHFGGSATPAGYVGFEALIAKATAAGFDVRFDSTIPAGAPTCHFTMWRSPDGTPPAWSGYTDFVNQKALKHADDVRRHEGNEREQQARHGEQHVGDAHDQAVDPAREGAGDEAEDGAEEGTDEERDDADDQRGASAVEDADAGSSAGAGRHPDETLLLCVIGKEGRVEIVGYHARGGLQVRHVAEAGAPYRAIRVEKLTPIVGAEIGGQRCLAPREGDDGHLGRRRRGGTCEAADPRSELPRSVTVARRGGQRRG